MKPTAVSIVREESARAVVMMMTGKTCTLFPGT